MIMMEYIIVGAGPCGLTLAYLLGRVGKKCIVLDQNDSIGGCHRVRRFNGMFTEHSPRVYLSNYVNTIRLLQEMGHSFYDLFTPYKFSIFYIASQLLTHLYVKETMIIIGHFMFFLLFSGYGETTSMQEFMTSYSFSDSSIDYLDRLCRFTDGGGIDRYSLFQFLQLLNQNVLYGVYQPRLPNDVGLFPIFQQAIRDTGNVTIQLQTKVTSILYDGTHVQGVSTPSGSILGQKVILAIPPNAFQSILHASPSPIPHTFGHLNKWVPASTYNNDIAVTFHWDTVLTLPSVWGFPSSDWGVISIPLTSYMNMNDPRSKTVISTCIVYTDRVSTVLGKTANQISDVNQFVVEIFRQLQQSYPGLPVPTQSILSPTAYYDNGWKESDSAFFKASSESYLSSHGEIPHLYQVGTQNGKSTSAFTTMEAAITNAMSFANKMVNTGIPVSDPTDLKTLAIVLLILAVIIVFLRKKE